MQESISEYQQNILANYNNWERIKVLEVNFFLQVSRKRYSTHANSLFNGLVSSHSSLHCVHESVYSSLL